MLIELMEGVEDLPGVVLDEGLSWDWTSIGDYLDHLETRNYDIDLATQVCHAPVLVFVLGERGADRAPATASEIDAMGAIVAEGIGNGALGFSTSRTLNHRTSRGEPTPTLHAARDELLGIARAVGATGTGVLQVVSDFSDADEDETLLEMQRVSGRPLSFSLVQAGRGAGYRRGLDLLERANGEGLAMRGQVAARAVGILTGLSGSVNPLARCATFEEVAHLPLDRQATALAAEPRRSRLLAELATHQRAGSLDRVFDLGDPPDYEPGPERSIAGLAAARGLDPVAYYLDRLVADEGRALLYLPFLNYADGNLDATATMLGHAFTIPGLGDGGAHVGTICDGSFPTTLLTHWTRDRTRGERFDLPFLVNRQSRATALAVGLADRGLIAPGYRGDLNVIDFDRLSLEAPRMVHDLPAGGRRLLQDATGYVHTIVAGIVISDDGDDTGDRPGRLVRGAKPDPGRHRP
jgi:N-acyl-D-aspartate/D-glutamate deacylase